MKNNTKLQVLQYGEYNGKLTVEKYRCIYSNKNIFGYDEEYTQYLKELREKRKLKQITEEQQQKRDKRNEEREDSIKRAKDSIFNIIVMNDFNYFATLTIDKSCEYFKNGFDSTDKKIVCKKLHNWLNDRVKRKGLKYIIIPEYHADKQKIHFHMLCNDVLEYADSERRLYSRGKGRRKAYKITTLKKWGVNIENLPAVYNIKEWKAGFSTAIQLDNEKERIARYVGKYIVKGNKAIFGKYYWSSKNIQRYPDEYLFHTDYEKVDFGNKTKIENVGLEFKYHSNISLTEEQEEELQEAVNERTRNNCKEHYKWAHDKELYSNIVQIQKERSETMGNPIKLIKSFAKTDEKQMKIGENNGLNEDV